jgi:cobalt-zinc-cadmium efflux system protein
VSNNATLESSAENIRALKWALRLTLSFFVVEVIGGWWANSLALLSDAGHMLSDILALAISLYASFVSRKAPTVQKSYGYYRTEVLAALFNGVMLSLMMGFLCFAAIQRFFQPKEVHGIGVIWIGSAGLLINLTAAWLLHGKEDLNVRGAYYHVWNDALGSAAALLSGILIYFTGWYPFDPLLGVLIGGIVLYSAWTLIRDSINILMESVPKHLNPETIRQSVLLCDGVENIHDLHIWSIGSRSHALSAHIKVPSRQDPLAVRARVEEVLRKQFELSHTTLQIEVHESCADSHE